MSFSAARLYTILHVRTDNTWLHPPPSGGKKKKYITILYINQNITVVQILSGGYFKYWERASNREVSFFYDDDDDDFLKRKCKMRWFSKKRKKEKKKDAVKYIHSKFCFWRRDLSVVLYRWLDCTAFYLLSGSSSKVEVCALHNRRDRPTA